jgi:hypothetical protein
MKGNYIVTVIGLVRTKADAGAASGAELRIQNPLLEFLLPLPFTPIFCHNQPPLL